MKMNGEKSRQKQETRPVFVLPRLVKCGLKTASKAHARSTVRREESENVFSSGY